MGNEERIWAEIDLDRIWQNTAALKKQLPDSTALCAVVKADGYGHGAVPVAKTLDSIADMYAVATIDEGIQLRKHKITKPILVLGPVPESRYYDLIKHGIIPSIFTMEQAKAMEEKAEWLGYPVTVHLAVDTGMGRIGLDAEDPDALDTAVQIASMPLLQVNGIFTHFATADEADKSYANRQLALFRQFVQDLEERGIVIPLRHCANSAGMIEKIGQDWDMARAGIAMYGVYPSVEVNRDEVLLMPVMELRAAITYVKKVPPGRYISYGARFCSEQEMEIATVSAGYADGYPRAMSEKGSVLVHGKRCRILGRVCMDQFMIDVSGLQVTPGDYATLLGKDGTEEIRIEEWEHICGGFSYELLCGIGKRVPRIYMRQGQKCGRQNSSQEIYEDFI